MHFYTQCDKLIFTRQTYRDGHLSGTWNLIRRSILKHHSYNWKFFCGTIANIFRYLNLINYFYQTFLHSLNRLKLFLEVLILCPNRVGYEILEEDNSNKVANFYLVFVSISLDKVVVGSLFLQSSSC